jgi:hypothetical protein
LRANRADASQSEQQMTEKSQPVSGISGMLRIAQSLNMANNRARSLKQTVTNGGGFRDRAIAEYHELLTADETLTPATFEKLRSAMRKNRLLYDERPIGVAFRPHFLERSQFEAHKATAELIALRDEYRSAGNLRFFEQMKKMLIDEPDQPSQAQVASELAIDRERGQTSLYRFRQRYQTLFRQEIAHTVAMPSELKTSFAIYCCSPGVTSARILRST